MPLSRGLFPQPSEKISDKGHFVCREDESASLSTKLVFHLHPMVPIFNSLLCLHVRWFNGYALWRQIRSWRPDRDGFWPAV